jgi:hypothetical protein
MPMNKQLFKKRIIIASRLCRDFTDKHIAETLPTKIAFTIDNSTNKINLEELLNTLWQENKVPVWVNLYVANFNASTVTLGVIYSESYSDDESQFYHQNEGFPPIHVVGPTIPEAWKSLEENGPFKFIPFH